MALSYRKTAEKYGLHSMFLSPKSDQELENYLKSMKLKYSLECYKINNFFLNQISRPITALLNKLNY